jgi:photosystem II PsbY protein
VSLAASLALPQAAFAAQEVAQLADNRPLILLGLGLPVIGWVLFNIAQPALRQLDSMQEEDSKPVKGKKR